MKASEYAKMKGLKSLKQAAEMLGLTPKCLRDWYIRERQRFEIVIDGCAKQIEPPKKNARKKKQIAQ